MPSPGFLYTPRVFFYFRIANRSSCGKYLECFDVLAMTQRQATMKVYALVHTVLQNYKNLDLGKIIRKVMFQKGN